MAGMPIMRAQMGEHTAVEAGHMAAEGADSRGAITEAEACGGVKQQVKQLNILVPKVRYFST